MIVADARSLLLADRREVESAISAASIQLETLISSHRDVAADDEHDPEGPTVSIQRAELTAMLRQSREHLSAVDAALGRLDDGTYGQCSSCGREIPAARLQARPFAHRCVTCAAREERS